MRLSFHDLRACVRQGALFPRPRRPFVDVDRARLANYEWGMGREQTRGAFFSALRDRVGRVYYQDLRMAHFVSINYAHRAFPCLRAYLAESLNDEWLSIVDWRKFQRDHALHQPLTAYAMAQLLSGGLVHHGELLIDGRPFLDHCIDALFRTAGSRYVFPFARSINLPESWLVDNSASRHIWAGIFRDAAYFAALFHDVAYMWQYSTKLLRGMSGLMPEAVGVSSGVVDGAHGLGERLLMCPLYDYKWPHEFEPLGTTPKYEEFMRRALGSTHGLPGGIAILNMADDVERQPRDVAYARGRLIVEWAALAVNMHDNAGLYADFPGCGRRMRILQPELRVQFEKDPLSAMLILADTVQEFGRRRARFTRYDGPETHINYSPQADATDVEWYRTPRGLGTLKITYRFSSGAELAMKRSYLPKDQKRLFDPARGYLDLSGCSIDRVKLDAQMI